MIRPALWTFEAHQEARFHLRAGAMDFGFAKVLDRRGKYLACEVHRFDGAIAISGTTQSHDPGVGIGLLPGADRISESALLTQFLEQPRGHSAAERLDKHRQRRKAQVRSRHARETEAPVRLL